MSVVVEVGCFLLYFHLSMHQRLLVMVYLTPTKRQRIISRYENTRDTENPPSMVEVGKQYGCAPSTVCEILKRWREHGTTYTRDKPGRPHKLSSRDEMHLIRDIRQEPRQPWAYFADKYNVSAPTIRKVAKDQGLHKRVMRTTPYISPAAKDKRLRWTRTIPGQDWRRVIFTDEVPFQLGEDISRRWTIRAAGEEYEPQHTRPTFRSSRQTLQVWGAIAYGKKWPLFRLPLAPSVASGGKRKSAEGLNGEKYAEWVIRGPLASMVDEMTLPQVRGTQQGVVAVEDGAPAHTSKVAGRARKDMGIQPLFHPPSSPDLNPIEAIWRTLKMRVGSIRPRATTLDELWGQICEVWEDMDINSINEQILSMPARCADVIKQKGYGTGW